MKVLTFEEWYEWVDSQFYPNGRERGIQGDEYRITDCALLMMKGQGTFEGDPKQEAKRRLGLPS